MRSKEFKFRSAGFTLMELLIVIGIIGILAALLVPMHKSSVRKANEASAISALNAIKIAQAKYISDHKDYGTFRQLFEEGYVDKRLNDDQPHHDGYVFIITLIPKAPGKSATYSVNANPEQWQGIGATGKNFYYTDPDNGISHSRDRPATAADDTF